MLQWDFNQPGAKVMLKFNYVGDDGDKKPD